MKKIFVAVLCLFMLCNVSGCGGSTERKAKTTEQVNEIMKGYEVKWYDDYSEEFQTQSVDITVDGNTFFIYESFKNDNEEILFILFIASDKENKVTIYGQTMKEKGLNYKEYNEKYSDEDNSDAIEIFEEFLNKKDVTYDEFMDWIPYALDLNE